ncbi:Hypothetical protein R9X50_00346500 [Acrodontium crateriforme]|uniref:UFSP1/2/DUB catalytic domain-containing protein n=1 Tax=Acrodontium crateriforme TaxID=150365 RepID=A0AAQ3M4C7_9PEZI|nr:Hypothetical protein R9X50_00346500 [Acrodontium crateriforme]
MTSSSDNSALHRRLGKADLGRHAAETCMPSALSQQLAFEDNSNTLPDVIPQLSALIAHDADVDVAWLCTVAAVQVSKLKGEGGHFCGYRNMQMLCLALGSRLFENKTGGDGPSSKPTILQLQDMIEAAWDRGINSHARTQTGGIKGTRKHVGTSEAEALLLSKSIACTGHAFQGRDAADQLLRFVENYFSSDKTSDSSGSKVHNSTRPPIFLQRPQHSITIVGFERTRSGNRRLLTFDPAYQPPSKMRELTEGADESSYQGWVARWTLRQYRKGPRYLGRYKQYECLVIDP